MVEANFKITQDQVEDITKRVFRKLAVDKAMSMRRTSTQLTRLYRSMSMKDSASVNAEREIREALCAVAAMVNETLTEGDLKEEVLACLLRARLYARESIAQDGLLDLPSIRVTEK